MATSSEVSYNPTQQIDDGDKVEKLQPSNFEAVGPWRSQFSSELSEFLESKNDCNSNLRGEVEKSAASLVKGTNWGEVMESSFLGCLLHEERLQLQVKQMCSDLGNNLDMLNNIKALPEDQILDNVEELCLKLCSFLKTVNPLVKDLSSDSKRYEAGRHVDLMRRLLPLLLQSIYLERNIEYSSLMSFSTKLMKSSIIRVEETLTGNINTEDINDNFVSLIDDALDLLRQRGIENGIVKNLVAEIVCQAMTLSQLASPDKCAVLSRISQKVMNDLNNLSDTLSSSLQELESCVNKLVLTFILEECCRPLDPIRKLVNSESNEEIIGNFDLHWERLYQASNLACSCSGDFKGVYAVKCDLSSLSLLETNIVPFIMSSKQGGRNNISKQLCVLLNHWAKEMQQLVEDLMEIVHPNTFEIIVMEKVEDILSDLYEETRTEHVKNYSQDILGGIKLLILVLKTEDKDVTAAVCQCTKAIKKYSTKSSAEHKTKLLHEIKQLTKYFNQDMKSKPNAFSTVEFPTDFHDLSEDVDPTKFYYNTPMKIGEPRNSSYKTPRKLVLPINNVSSDEIIDIVDQLTTSIATPERIHDIQVLHKKLQSLRKNVLIKSMEMTTM